MYSDNFIALLGDSNDSECHSEPILLLSLTGFIWKSCLLGREKRSFFFFLLKELLNFIFSSRCKETGIKNSV